MYKVTAPCANDGAQRTQITVIQVVNMTPVVDGARFTKRVVKYFELKLVRKARPRVEHFGSTHCCSCGGWKCEKGRLDDSRSIN
jgi:hypothetical protein